MYAAPRRGAATQPGRFCVSPILNLFDESIGSGNNSLALNGASILGTCTGGTGTDSLAFFSSTPDLSNAAITGFENLTLSNNANITASIVQMSQFTGTFNAAGNEALNLTMAGTFNAFSTIEKYDLANGSNNFTSANVAVNVIDGAGKDVLNFSTNQIINFLTMVDGGNGTTFSTSALLQPRSLTLLTSLHNR